MFAGKSVEETGPQLTAGVREGDVLAGKYRVDKVLGIGGMGVVVAARHLQLDTKVAIKFLLPEMLGSTEAVSRFAREARAAVKITNEHVARVFDVGTLESGAPYMVMEFLEGGDLAAWVQQRGALPVETAVEFVLQACIAIAEAHGLGIVHRDLKPANLFCIRRADGQLSVKVLDFGISKVTDLSGSGPGMSVTKTSAMMGSPLYMSPEQMQSTKDAGPQTDIWALGVVLYELLAGTTPFVGETLPEVCVKIATQAPPPLRSYRRDVPSGLEAVILRCLEKDCRRRYQNIAEFATGLAGFGSPRARASLDRIMGTIQSGAPSTGLPQDSSQRNTGAGATSGTLLAVGTTGWRTDPAGRVQGPRWGLIAAGAAVTVAAALSFAFLRKAPSADSASPPGAAAQLPAAMATQLPPAATEKPEPLHAVVPAPAVTASPAATAPAATPGPAGGPEPAVAPATQVPASKGPAAHSTAHPRPPPVAAAAVPPIAAPPPVAVTAATSPTPTPPAHHATPNANPLDLPLQ
jgi:hypothetical protein